MLRRASLSTALRRAAFVTAVMAGAAALAHNSWADPSRAQTVPSITLEGGADGAYFSVGPGFNVVTVRVAGVDGGAAQALTARFDGDGVTDVFSLTNLATSAIEGETMVVDETPAGSVDGTNRDFTTIQAVGDSNVAEATAVDGFVDDRDVAVAVNGATLDLSDYGIVTQGPGGQGHAAYLQHTRYRGPGAIHVPNPPL